MIVDDPTTKPGYDSRLSSTTLQTLNDDETQNTLAWTRLLLDRAHASELTLIALNPTRPVSPLLVFVFSQDSLLNTTISVFGQQVYSFRSDV